MTTAPPELGALLAERPADARERARRALTDLAGDRPLVLHGAGGVGRSVLAALRAGGIEPLCFSDGAAKPGADQIEGVDVLPLSDAVARHGEGAVFVVTILNPRFPYTEVRESLITAGAQTVCSFIPVAWAHPDGLLPHYAVDLPQRVLEQAGAVREAYALFEDERSRREFRAQVAWRLTADFSLLADHLPTSEQYFSRDVLELRNDDVFVDCGAFDGDTIQSLVAHRPDGVARIIALEPDPENLRALEARLDALGAGVRERVSVLPWAAGARRGMARWGLPGTSSAGLDSAGELEVQVAPLDELLERGIAPTYVKMDIEGAEPDALQGASQIVTRHRPTLAICVYHAQDHLWRLPLAVAALVDDYRFVLRRYESDCWEVVLYAIPRERARGDALAR